MGEVGWGIRRHVDGVRVLALALVNAIGSLLVTKAQTKESLEV